MMGTETHADTSATTGKTLLLVDDTPENLNLLGQILMPHYVVRVASSGARALRVLQGSPKPDLILLDIMMPEMDGYEVLRQIKQQDDTRNIPVIFVTALSDVDDETRGFQMGAVDYITKPVRPAIVLARVRAHLELKEARDRLDAQNHWLEEEVERRIHQNQIIQDVTLRALASLAEIRDNETGAHILRTQGYVQALAEHMATMPEFAALLTPRTIADYRKAAPLHDIGKVGIPDSILHKPGKLTDGEWSIMKTHAALGAEAIWQAIRDEEDRVAIGFLYIAMDIARCHHEKWDGSGYPRGLRGDDIPLAARLMALADVFDALINKRVYKPAFTLDEAAGIIMQGRGSHFDPRVVDAFVACRDQFSQIAARYSDEEQA